MDEKPQPQKHDFALAFTANHDPAAARRRFAERYGHEPQYCVIDPQSRLLLLGPVKVER